ncbi:thioesterase family protein [Pseudoteredinibacter isoporae]|uniref:Acyl-CoA thioester hydrolase n=1 Tax=Pseudoteredinibacter isoporae TaxID=570281 RepID=A0A7X0JWE3_9GAMM|nr:thioesterase family protein [Pseudoteredinibacter isoporae]MBB6522656.1 acyl-CoA thioester hydrolase [Pseudoteredinibacter isoporae]NHO88187.1 thioesterase [Pseudoteredinibacter isoporae]NIB23482.1 thioesterase [Pseudoteredinibacter isoporae]
MFEEITYAAWGDMDFNSHMGNSAYLDKAGDVRMRFFAANEFPMQEFMRLKIGPVVMKDEIEYFREVKLLEELRVSLSMAGLSPDGSRFLMRNEFWRTDGKLAARITSAGGWLDLSRRGLTEPPEALLNALRSLSQTDDFQSLPSSIR